jgi:transposase-like protein
VSQKASRRVKRRDLLFPKGEPKKDFKWKHFKPEIILTSIRWYVAYPLSYRKLEKMLKERVLEEDHSSIQRWFVWSILLN